MKKRRVAIPDAVLGGLLTSIILLLFLFQFGPLETIEAKLYDLRARFRASGDAGQKIAIVEIDEPSVDQLGRYPWPRARIAEAIDVLSEAGAKVVGLDVLYPDPEQNQGLEALRRASSSSGTPSPWCGRAARLPQRTRKPDAQEQGKGPGRNTRGLD